METFIYILILLIFKLKAGKPIPVNTRYHFKKLLVGNITPAFLRIFLLINVFYSLIRKISI